MSNSSQLTNSLDGLTTNTITLDNTGTSTITYTEPSSYSYTYDSSSMSTITIGSVGGSYTIGSISAVPAINTVSIDTSQFSWNLPEEWVGTFPDWDRVEDMCKKYPALEIALRNFKTVYQLVKDDYDNPTPKK
jgi:hypothetical protein